MKPIAILIAAAVILTPMAAAAQLPVTAMSDDAQATMLKAGTPQARANKKLVYDMWRSFVVARHVDTAPTFFTEAYLQHNPTVPSGRDAAVKYFALRPATDIPPDIANLVNMTAEGDFVIMSTVRKGTDPKIHGGNYTTTWFDMYRIKDGKIDEHWDCQGVGKDNGLAAAIN